MDGQTNGQTDGWTDKQTDRQTDTHTYTPMLWKKATLRNQGRTWFKNTAILYYLS